MRNWFIILFFSTTILNTQVFSQSIVLEIGASKSFVLQSDKYEQPNLAFQFKHKVASRFEYSVNYFCFKQYWPSEYHDISQFVDKEEIQWRYVHGMDLSVNFLPFIDRKYLTNFMLGFGPSIRYRQEELIYDCHYTVDGWPECLGYFTEDYDFGGNLIIDFDYILFHNIGLSISSALRIYDESVYSLSFNGGLIYKFYYSK